MSRMPFEAPQFAIAPQVDVYQEGRTILPQVSIGYDPGVDWTLIGQTALQVAGDIYSGYKEEKIQNEQDKLRNMLDEYSRDTQNSIRLLNAQGNADKVPEVITSYQAKANQALGTKDFTSDEEIPDSRFKRDLFFRARAAFTDFTITQTIEDANYARENDEKDLADNLEFTARSYDARIGAAQKINDVAAVKALEAERDQAFKAFQQESKKLSPRSQRYFNRQFGLITKTAAVQDEIQAGLMKYEDRQQALGFGLAQVELNIQKAQTPEEVDSIIEEQLRELLVADGFTQFSTQQPKDFVGLVDVVPLSVSFAEAWKTMSPFDKARYEKAFPKISGLVELAEKTKAGMSEAFAKELEQREKGQLDQFVNLSAIVAADVDAAVKELKLASERTEFNMEDDPRDIAKFNEAMQKGTSLLFKVAEKYGLEIATKEDGTLDLATLQMQLTGFIPKEQFDNINRVFTSLEELQFAARGTAVDSFKANLKLRNEFLTNRTNEIIAQGDRKLTEINASNLPEDVKTDLIRQELMQIGRSLQNVYSPKQKQRELYGAYSAYLTSRGLSPADTLENDYMASVSGFDLLTSTVDKTAYLTGTAGVVSRGRVDFENLRRKYVKVADGESEAQIKRAQENSLVAHALVTGDTKPGTPSLTSDNIAKAARQELNKFSPLFKNGEPVGFLAWHDSIPEENRSNIPFTLVMEHFGVEIQTLGRLDPSEPQNQDILARVESTLRSLQPPTQDALVGRNIDIPYNTTLVSALANSFDAGPFSPAAVYPTLGYPQRTRASIITALKDDDRYNTSPTFIENVNDYIALHEVIESGGSISFDSLVKLKTQYDKHADTLEMILDSGFITNTLFKSQEKTGGSDKRKEYQDRFTPPRVAAVTGILPRMLDTHARVNTIPGLESVQFVVANPEYYMDPATEMLFEQAIQSAFLELADQDSPLIALDEGAKKRWGNRVRQELSEYDFVNVVGNNGKTKIMAQKKIWENIEPDKSVIKDITQNSGYPTDDKVILRDMFLEAPMITDRSDIGTNFTRQGYGFNSSVPVEDLTAVGAVLAQIDGSEAATRVHRIDLVNSIVSVLGEDTDNLSIAALSFVISTGQEVTRDNYNKTKKDIKEGKLGEIIQTGANSLEFRAIDSTGKTRVRFNMNSLSVVGVKPSPTWENGLAQEEVVRMVTEDVNKAGSSAAEYLMRRVVNERGPTTVNLNDGSQMNYSVEQTENGYSVLVATNTRKNRKVLLGSPYWETEQISRRVINSEAVEATPELANQLSFGRYDTKNLEILRSRPTLNSTHELVGVVNLGYGGERKTFIQYNRNQDSSISRTVFEDTVILGKTTRRVLSTDLISEPVPAEIDVPLEPISTTRSINKTVTPRPTMVVPTLREAFGVVLASVGLGSPPKATETKTKSEEAIKPEATSTKTSGIVDFINTIRAKVATLSKPETQELFKKSLSELKKNLGTAQQTQTQFDGSTIGSPDKAVAQSYLGEVSLSQMGTEVEDFAKIAEELHVQSNKKDLLSFVRGVKKIIADSLPVEVQGFWFKFNGYLTLRDAYRSVYGEELADSLISEALVNQVQTPASGGVFMPQYDEQVDRPVPTYSTDLTLNIGGAYSATLDKTLFGKADDEADRAITRIHEMTHATQSKKPAGRVSHNMRVELADLSTAQRIAAQSIELPAYIAGLKAKYYMDTGEALKPNHNEEELQDFYDWLDTASFEGVGEQGAAQLIQTTKKKNFGKVIRNLLKTIAVSDFNRPSMA